MSEHFNGLTPAQTERIALLAEEAAEIVAICCKALRHGLDSFNPDEPDDPNNAGLIARELGDMEYAVALLVAAGDIPAEWIKHGRTRASNMKPHYLHHQEEPRP